MRKSLFSLALSLQLWGGLAFTPACWTDEDPAEPDDSGGERDAGEDPGPGPDTPTPPDDPETIVPPTKVDVLLMIDNSGSMGDEQRKLAAVLDQLVGALSVGRAKSANGSGEMLEFPPVESIHIGVVTSDMGVNGAPPQKSCGYLSFSPTERNTTAATTFEMKAFGDDGILQTSTAVAQDGIWITRFPSGEAEQVVPADPSCADVTLPAGQRYLSYEAGVSDVAETAHAFSCLAKRGKNGCGLEQQLEAALKAVTPSDSALRFTEGSATGQGGAIDEHHTPGPNKGFLREDAILVVVLVSDEEDCSIPDSSNAIFDAMSTQIPGEINVRCGLAQNQHYLHPVRRYVDGLRALKPVAYQDRILVASVVGVPRASQTETDVHTGSEAIQALLDRDDMQFAVRRNASGTADEPAPTCTSDQGEGTAAPGRRFVELSKEFGDNGVVASICESDYSPIIQTLAGKVGELLKSGDELQ